MRDLLGLPERPGLGPSFQPDPPLGRFANNIRRLTVTSGHWLDYQQAAEEIAARVVSDASIYEYVVGPDPETRSFVERFGARAFRRPLASSEVDRYVALFGEGATHYPDLESFDAGVRLVVEAMLQSPHFLYRTELSAEDVGGIVALNDFEIASRLSYALWNSMPPDGLFTVAAEGELQSRDGISEWASMLFDDVRAQEQFDSFHFQAYALHQYSDIDKDLEVFPQWNATLGELLQEETRRFLGSVVFEKGTVADLLISPRAWVNDELAALYGMEGTFGTELEPVELDRSQRAGLLTRLGFLAQNASLTEPDPIHRGVSINIDLLCRSISAVPDLPPDLMPVGDTNRERIDSITGVGTCGEGCHANIINPLGYALEEFNAIGEHRIQDNGFPVDTAATYTFEDGRTIDFDGAVDLSQQLAQAPEFHACYVRQLLEYLFGRDLQENDLALAEELAQASIEHGLTIQELTARIVASDLFLFRPAEDAAVDTGAGQ